MKLRDLFNSDDLKRSKKRKALQKILIKLEKTRDKLERELKSEELPPKIKKLEIRLKTNKKHRKKVKFLLSELDKNAPATAGVRT